MEMCKIKILRKLIFIVVMIIGVIFVSCTKESVIDKDVEELPYLSLNNNNTNEKFSDKDLKIFESAFKRMEITKENGIYTTKWTSGKQINISEDLFKLIKDGIGFSNLYYSGLSKKYKAPRFKQTSSEQVGASTDCVQQAIWIVSELFSCNISYSSINSWVVSQYGNQGLTSLGQFNTACSHYFIGSSSSISNGYGAPLNGEQIIVIIPSGSDGSGAQIFHACVLVSYANGAILYRDKNGLGALITTATFPCYRISGGCH
jgi:hypothetical protein